MDAGMFKAAIHGNDGFFEEIEGVNLNLTQLTGGGNSILHVAAISGKVQITQRILEINSQQSLLYKKNWKGDTALHIAARLGHFNMTKHLITCANDREVEVRMELLRMENLEKNTALHEAIKNNHYDIIQLLIKEDPGLTFLPNNAGESPLFLAVDRGFFKIAIHILEAVPECSNVGRKSMNVLHAAVIRTQRSKPFKDIEEKAAWHSHTLLCIYNFLRAILKLSKSENEQAPKRGMTILDFVGELLEACPFAIVEADDFGWIPLHYAAHFGNAKFVNLFLKKNMSLVYIKDKTGMSALHISATEGRVDVTRTLITECPDSCELLDNRGRTALHLAAENGNSEVVKVFLQTLASEDLINILINQPDKEGNTPFHLAAMEGRYALLMMLAKDRRIDWMAMNKAGMSTVDIIQSDNRLERREKKEIESMLNRYDIRQSLERTVGRKTMKVQTLDTEGHGQLIQETEKKEPAEVRTGMSAANDAKKNEVKDIAPPPDRKVEETQEAIRKMAEVNILVSTLVASVTYSAVINVPGGYDNNGTAILGKNKDFKQFLSYNFWSFTFSLLSLLIQFCVGPVRADRTITGSIFVLLYLTSTEFSLLFLANAFFWAIKAVWTERLTDLINGGNKWNHLLLEDFESVSLFVVIFFMIVFVIFNIKYLVPVNIRCR